MSPLEKDALYRAARDVALAMHALQLGGLQDDVRRTSAALYLNTALFVRASDPEARVRYAEQIAGDLARLVAALDLAQQLPAEGRTQLRGQLEQASKLLAARR